MHQGEAIQHGDETVGIDAVVDLGGRSTAEKFGPILAL